LIGKAHKAGWRKPSGLFAAAAYNIGTFALPFTLWVAAFIFRSPSLVEKATRG